MTSSPGAVLVTGASTGIGRAIVHDLSGRGVRVFAAVRDLTTVEDHRLVTAVRLDVTSAAEAVAAAATVREALDGAPLHGLVNNAGIAVGGPLEFLDLDEMRRQLEVNVVGQLAVTQAFLPLLRQGGGAGSGGRRQGGGGRIVFTSSIGGRIGAPFIGPYAASKHALNGMAESLRRELMPWKIGVSVLAPATVATPIWDKAAADVQTVVGSLPAEATDLYGTEIAAMQSMVGGAEASGIPASDVAAAAHHALYSRRPKAEYVIGREAKIAATASTLLPYRVFDRAVRGQITKG